MATITNMKAQLADLEARVSKLEAVQEADPGPEPAEPVKATGAAKKAAK